MAGAASGRRIARAMRADGWTQQDIAEAIGKARSTVADHLAACPDAGHAAMRADGWTFQAIADALDQAKETVRRTLTTSPTVGDVVNHISGVRKCGYP